MGIWGLMWQGLATQEVLSCLGQQVMLTEWQHLVFIRGTWCILIGLVLLMADLVLLTRLFKALRWRFRHRLAET